MSELRSNNNLLPVTGGRMHDGKRWRLVQQIGEYRVGWVLIRGLKWKETVFSLVAEAQSAFIHTLFSAGAGLSLSKEEPMMEGGAKGSGEVGGGETTDAELIGVGVSWG